MQTAATTPITMPVIAPPDMPWLACGEEVATGLEDAEDVVIRVEVLEALDAVDGDVNCADEA